MKTEGSQSFEILRQWEPGLRPHHLELGDLQPISNWRVQYRRWLWDYLYERNMLHCECGQATTPDQLERAKRFGIKADPRGHVHSFHGVSA